MERRCLLASVQPVTIDAFAGNRAWGTPTRASSAAPFTGRFALASDWLQEGFDRLHDRVERLQVGETLLRDANTVALLDAGYDFQGQHRVDAKLGDKIVVIAELVGFNNARDNRFQLLAQFQFTHEVFPSLILIRYVSHGQPDVLSSQPLLCVGSD